MQAFSSKNDIVEVIELLVHGEYVLINGYYSDGLFLVKEIHKYLKLKLPNNTFKEQQEYRAAYFKLSNLVLLQVLEHKLCVKKAPSIGWLKKLYLTFI